jgi:hydrogenase maturation protease
MKMESTKRICVLGLGNLMRVDDAVGMMALRALAESGLVRENALGEIAFVEGGTLGLDLMYALTGVTHLLALDAVDVGAEPGTLVRFEKHELGEIPSGKSVHLLGFSDLMGVMKLMGDEPEEIVLLGVQPKRIDWGTELTEEVQRAMGGLLTASRRQLEAWLSCEGWAEHAVSAGEHA